MSLPINPTLASALSIHCTQPLAIAKNTSVAIANSNTSFNTRNFRNVGNVGNNHVADNRTSRRAIHALAVHPTLPRVAYLEEETILDNASSPSLPTSGKKGKSSSKNSALSPSSSESSRPSSVVKQRLIIQTFHRPNGNSSASNNNNNNTANSDNSTLATLSMEHLPPLLNQFRAPKSKTSKVITPTNPPNNVPNGGSNANNSQLTLASIGPLQHIQFLDRESLFWQTRRKFGSLSNMNSFTAQSTSEKMVINGDTQYELSEGGMGYGLCLGLKFLRALVVLRFNPNHDTTGINSKTVNSPTKTTPVAAAAIESTPFTILCLLEGQRTNPNPIPNKLAAEKSTVQYTPSSPLLPVSPSIFVYGCSDGAMRFHNLVPSMLYSSSSSSSPGTFASANKVRGMESLDHFSFSTSSFPVSNGSKLHKQVRQATIKSVRGPNGRNDPVVQILNVDPAYERSFGGARDGIGGIGATVQTPQSAPPTSALTHHAASDATNSTTLVLRSRLLTICASGVAYFWDVDLILHRSTGAVKDLAVLPPLVRLDGLGSLVLSPRKGPPSSSSTSQSFWDGATKVHNHSDKGSTKDKSTNKSNADVEEPSLPYYTKPPNVKYDPQRDLLIWTLPPRSPLGAVDHRNDYKLPSLSPNSPEAKKEKDDWIFLSHWVDETGNAANGANGGFLKVWNLALVDPLLQATHNPSDLTPQPPPRMPPAMIMRLPHRQSILPSSFASSSSPLSSPSSSASSSRLSVSLDPSVTSIAGLAHAPLSYQSMANLSLSADGTALFVQAGLLSSYETMVALSYLDTEGASQDFNAPSTPRSSLATNKRGSIGIMSSISGTGSMEKDNILYTNCTSCHSIPFSSLLRKNKKMKFARGVALAASYFWPDTVVVATDQGIAVVNLANLDGDSWASPNSNNVDGSLMWNLTPPSRFSSANSNAPGNSSNPNTSHTPTGSFHTIISGGLAGGVANTRLGVLFVENESVYASRLSTISSMNRDRKMGHSCVEKVELPDPVRLCPVPSLSRPGNSRNFGIAGTSENSLNAKVPFTIQRSSRIFHIVDSNTHFPRPPRLIPSPSGRYLCLFFREEERYEILHAGSLLAREHHTQQFHIQQKQMTGGSNILTSLGGLDPFVDSGKKVASFAWIGDEDHFAILRPGKKMSSAKTNDGRTTSSDNSSNAKPRVDLLKLAQVQFESTELAAGASVAAATTVNLGSISVRGGDRVFPVALFGGPALCIGCVPVSDNSSSSMNAMGDDRIAYFYFRKQVAIKENDESGSAYSSIGVSIPFPDLVSWDDDGKMCAIAIGFRVAVYLSEPPNFTLIGSIHISSSISSTSDVLVSMKFIHGVLYCSTQSSVRVILLGNLKERNKVCELDSFSLATNCVPLYGRDDFDYSCPTPSIAKLDHPHIMTYHSGGLLVSTSCGLRLIPLSHPLVRIGTLLAANMTERARKWILAAPTSDHEVLSRFLNRRGRVDLTLSDLNGLSLETYIDLCMQYEYTDELERLITTQGASVCREICDWGRDEEVNGSYSAIFSIGMFLIGKGKIDCAKTLISHAIGTEMTDVLSDAMKLATMISVVDNVEGRAFLERVTEAMNFDSSGRIPFVSIIT